MSWPCCHPCGVYVLCISVITILGMRVPSRLPTSCCHAQQSRVVTCNDSIYVATGYAIQEQPHWQPHWRRIGRCRNYISMAMSGYQRLPSLRIAWKGTIYCDGWTFPRRVSHGRNGWTICCISIDTAGVLLRVTICPWGVGRPICPHGMTSMLCTILFWNDQILSRIVLATAAAAVVVVVRRQ